MLALELLGNGENRPKVHADEIKKAIDSLQNESHKVNEMCSNDIPQYEIICIMICL